MKCNHQIIITQKGRRILVPCGKCYNCRKNRRNGWYVRFLEETKSAKSAFFLTLTYSEENVPTLEVDGMIHKVLDYRDVQLFLKRWRKYLSKYDIKLRFYACSEYGSKTGRPHYHMLCWFNKPLDTLRMSTAQRKDVFESKWSKGFTSISRITSKRMYYVTKYMLKSRSNYESNIYRPMRCYCSNGIGANYLTAARIAFHKQALFPFVNSRSFFTYTAEDGFRYSLPRYYKDKIFNDVEKAKILIEAEIRAHQELQRRHDADVLQEKEFYQLLKEKTNGKSEEQKREVAQNLYRNFFLLNPLVKLEEQQKELIKQQTKTEVL